MVFVTWNQNESSVFYLSSVLDAHDYALLKTPKHKWSKLNQVNLISFTRGVNINICQNFI